MFALKIYYIGIPKYLTMLIIYSYVDYFLLENIGFLFFLCVDINASPTPKSQYGCSHFAQTNENEVDTVKNASC